VTVLDAPRASSDEPEHPHVAVAPGILGWLTTTDHKKIGISYMVTAFGFFMLGGALAEIIRAQLFSPESRLVSPGTYNEIFTMHGSIMMYLFIVPFAIGLANYLVPLQIGAREMAFPRLNALGYWLYLFGGLTMVSGFLTADGAAAFGWTGYAPLSNDIRSPSVGGDLWLGHHLARPDHALFDHDHGDWRGGLRRPRELRGGDLLHRAQAKRHPR